MGCRDCRGLEDCLVQYETPNWDPLVQAVGERLAEGFMSMHEARLEDGTHLHAYKHISTRRYLYLSEEGEAYESAPCERFVVDRLDFAIERAICPWWILAGWERKDVDALRAAIERTPPSTVWKP